MPPAIADGPRQLPLDLAHREARSRDDLVVGPSNAEAVALMDRWPDWPAPWSDPSCRCSRAWAIRS